MSISARIKRLLKNMTLEEKVGQLHQVPPFFFSDSLVNEVAGPLRKYKITEQQLYRAGSILGTAGPQEMRTLQAMYLEKSRLKIPLLFMADIIHGYKTIYPIPLGIAATFSPKTAKDVARMAALEATRSGLHVTFSPMADLARDTRWGRVMESSGEDPYVNYEMTYATVKGYQGERLSDPTTLAACGKHVIAYGAAVAGKDYTQAELSRHSLYQYYLEGYRACVDAEAELLMSSFNVVEGIPSTVSSFVLKDTIRKHLGFKGVIISDYDSLDEAQFHRVTPDGETTALRGIESSLDIEMTSGIYQNHLIPLIRSGKVSETLLDQAVIRILTLKEKLGLFDDPYRGVNEQDEAALPLSEAHMEIAYKASIQSPILLENEGLLPLNFSNEVVCVGSLLSEQNLLGAWAWHGEHERTDSLEMVLKQRYSTHLIASDKLTDEDETTIKKAKTIVVFVGERSKEFGEARSKVDPSLSIEHVSLITKIASLNPHIVSVVLAGRPLIITPIVPMSQSILYSFYLGSSMASALIDLLNGTHNPSGRLPMTLPSHVGQLPIITHALPTGRPYHGKPFTYTSHYVDGGNTPLYVFGHGLSYTSFELIKANILHENDQTIDVNVTVKNTGSVSGSTVVFVRLKTPIVGIALPETLLVGFQRVTLERSMTQTMTITLHKKHFQYYDGSLKRHPFARPYTLHIQLDHQTLDVLA